MDLTSLVTNTRAEPLLRLDVLSSLISSITPYYQQSTGMELPSSRYQSQNSRETPSASESSAMATLTMRAPGNMLPSPRDASWEDRSSAAMPTRPRSRNERIELPSIRQVHHQTCFRNPKYLTIIRQFLSLNKDLVRQNKDEETQESTHPRMAEDL